MAIGSRSCAAIGWAIPSLTAMALLFLTHSRPHPQVRRRFGAFIFIAVAIAVEGTDGGRKREGGTEGWRDVEVGLGWRVSLSR